VPGRWTPPIIPSIDLVAQPTHTTSSSIQYVHTCPLLPCRRRQINLTPSQRTISALISHLHPLPLSLFVHNSQSSSHWPASEIFPPWSVELPGPWIMPIPRPRQDGVFRGVARLHKHTIPMSRPSPTPSSPMVYGCAPPLRSSKKKTCDTDAAARNPDSCIPRRNPGRDANETMSKSAHWSFNSVLLFSAVARPISPRSKARRHSFDCNRCCVVPCRAVVDATQQWITGRLSE